MVVPKLEKLSNAIFDCERVTGKSEVIHLDEKRANQTSGPPRIWEAFCYSL
jgi:hypothetical protein